LLERTDLRIAALRREAYEFKRDVVVAGENPRTGKIMAEKVVKYYEDQQRAKDGLLDKLRLKIGTLRGQHAKLEASWHQKEEVGDVLHYIDFHQLQIENKQYLAKIEEKNAELIRLKLSTGKTIQTLNAMKVQLSEVGRETTRLRGDIRTRTGLLKRLKAENGALATQVAAAHSTGIALSRQAKEASDMPTIMDYVQLKALQAQLTHEATSWARKVEIMDLTAKQAALKSGRLGVYADTLAAAPIRTTVRLHSAGAGGITTRVLGASATGGGGGVGGAGGPSATLGSTALSSLGSTAASKTRVTRPAVSAGSSGAGGGLAGGRAAASGRGVLTGASGGIAHSPIRVPPPKGVAGFSGSVARGGSLRLGLTTSGRGAGGGGGAFAAAGGSGARPSAGAAFGSTARR